MSKLLKGRELRKIFDHYCPFDEDGNLRPESERATIMATNSNNWWQTRAYVQASAAGEQSPIIIQFSYNANRKIGGDPSSVFKPDNVEHLGNAMAIGAEINAKWVELEAENWGADLVAISLDHFKVPEFTAGATYKTRSNPFDYARQIDEAVTYLKDKSLEEVVEDEMDAQTRQAYVKYLNSEEYQNFRSHFLITVSIMDPAWGMIDTEGIPPVLDFVITKDISRGVRVDLNNDDMMLEAELGATGKSGDEVEYQEPSQAELDAFAELAAAFIDYTGSEGIAYDIGMKHAAKGGEQFEPDHNKLETVQRRIIENSGVYAPFAQHGGTGAATVPHSLVGKTNLNTCFLVAGSQGRYKHFDDNRDLVLSGDKNACGTDVETKVYLESMYEEVVSRYQITGSYQIGSECLKLLAE